MMSARNPSRLAYDDWCVVDTGGFVDGLSWSDPVANQPNGAASGIADQPRRTEKRWSSCRLVAVGLQEAAEASLAPDQPRWDRARLVNLRERQYRFVVQRLMRTLGMVVLEKLPA